MPSTQVAWLVFPLVVWCLARLLLVAPAESQVTYANRLLLDAEHEMISQQVATERAELEVSHMERRVSTMLSDAQRLQAALTQARSELGISRHREGPTLSSTDDDASELELRPEPG